MKIAVTDYSFKDLEIESKIFHEAGFEIVSWKTNREADVLAGLLTDCDAVVTQFAPVNSDVISRMGRAKVIVRYGIGVDNVDLDAAREKGIPVCNIPDYCIDEVADHTLAFLLSATRQVVSNDRFLKQGEWGLATPLTQMKALRDLTVGVVGFGRIGREVISRLIPFKSRVLVSDPFASPDEIKRSGGTAVSLETLLSESDVITLHCPSMASTRRMINEESLQKVKPGVILVNVARGDLICTDALVQALKSGQVSVAALDVFQPEPLPIEHPLRAMGNVIGASHIASTSVPSFYKLRETAATLAVNALRGEPLRNVVNGVTSIRRV